MGPKSLILQHDAIMGLTICAISPAHVEDQIRSSHMFVKFPLCILFL